MSDLESNFAWAKVQQIYLLVEARRQQYSASLVRAFTIPVMVLGIIWLMILRGQIWQNVLIACCGAVFGGFVALLAVRRARRSYETLMDAYVSLNVAIDAAKRAELHERFGR